MGSIIETTKPMKAGERYGRWVLLEDREIGKKPLCKCDCGTVRRVCPNSLWHGGTKSCGCIKREVCAARLLTHGQSGRGSVKRGTKSQDASTEYHCWLNIR